MFSEFLKLIDVASKLEFKENGELNIEVYIPVMQNVYELRPCGQDDLWDIFNYCKNYYGFVEEEGAVE